MTGPTGILSGTGKAPASEYESGGASEIDVTDLSGELADETKVAASYGYID